MWFFDNKSNMITGSFEDNLKNLQLYYSHVKEENRKLKDTIQKLEADKLNDERVRELTEEINYMKSYGFYLTPEDVQELNEARKEFKKNHPELEYDEIWRYGITHIGEVAACWAEYKDKYGHIRKEQICVICH
jgi:hypothetical protein